jgi:hypothetical protein
MRNVVIAITSVLSLMVVNALAADNRNSVSVTCSVAIEQPKQGANVGGDGNVSGHVSKPEGTHAWAIARRKGVSGWWPQGGGPLEVNDDGTFDAWITYGEDRDKGAFEVAVIVVDAEVNKLLTSWVDRTNQSGRYPPIGFPNVHDGCPVGKVIVNKQ